LTPFINRSNGDDIEVTSLAVTGNQVRIGIDTPEKIPVH
jgi:carbon storage regulator CsrA